MLCILDHHERNKKSRDGSTSIDDTGASGAAPEFVALSRSKARLTTRQLREDPYVDGGIRRIENDRQTYAVAFAILRKLVNQGK